MPTDPNLDASEVGWEKCSDGWRKVFSPTEAKILFGVDVGWKEARVKDAIAALLVSAGAIEMAPEDSIIGARALLIPVRDWSDEENPSHD